MTDQATDEHDEIELVLANVDVMLWPSMVIRRGEVTTTIQQFLGGTKMGPPLNVQTSNLRPFPKTLAPPNKRKAQYKKSYAQALLMARSNMREEEPGTSPGETVNGVANGAITTQSSGTSSRKRRSPSRSDEVDRSNRREDEPGTSPGETVNGVANGAITTQSSGTSSLKRRRIIPSRSDEVRRSNRREEEPGTSPGETVNGVANGSITTQSSGTSSRKRRSRSDEVRRSHSMGLDDLSTKLWVGFGEEKEEDEEEEEILPLFERIMHGQEVTPLMLIFIQFVQILTNMKPSTDIDDASAFMCAMTMMSLFMTLLSNTFPANVPFSLKDRYFTEVPQQPWHGRDVFSMICHHRFEFWLITSETPETFPNMLCTIYADMHSRHRKRPCIISPSNRLLMTLIWLRQYPVYAILALTFNVRKSVVCRTIHRTWLALYKHYAPNVRWPDRREWRRLARRWPDMPNIVAAIDGTSHEIQIPTNHQQLFYSGHRKFHCIHTQVIINNNKDIVFLKSGFLGHFNDASTYRELPSIGPGMDLDFPANLRIIADSIYPCRYPLITPYKSASIARQPPHQQHRMRKINLTLRSRRVYVEHVIKEIKTFRVIGGIYRHKRHFLAHITELCAGLSQRKAEFLERYT